MKPTLTVKVASATHESPLPLAGEGPGGEGNGHDFHDRGVPRKVMTVWQTKNRGNCTGFFELQL